MQAPEIGNYVCEIRRSRQAVRNFVVLCGPEPG